MNMTRIPEGIIPDIVGAIIENRNANAGTRPVRSTYASKLGHPCERYLTYLRVAWDLLPKPGAGLMGIFRRGRLIGEDIAQEARDSLKQKGVDVVEQETNIPPNEFDIGGRIDFAISVRETPAARPLTIPVEAKSMNEYTFDKLPEEDADAIVFLLDAPQAYLRCYPGQILTYCHFRQVDVGMIYIRKPTTFADRQIVVRYDDHLEYVEGLLQKAARLKGRVTSIEKLRTKMKVAGTTGDFLSEADALFPDRVDYHPDTCGKCDFCPWCVPDITRAQGIIDRMDDALLNLHCQTFFECAETRKAYEEANAKIGDHVKAILIDEPVGTTKTILTQGFGIVAKKGAKSVTKKILSLAELSAGGSGNDD